MAYPTPEQIDAAIPVDGEPSRALTNAAIKSIISESETKASATDPRFTDSRTPTGPAGGVLAGTYPNPSFAQDMATAAQLDTKIDKTQIGVNGGVAPLDDAGVVPTEYLNVSGLNFFGAWDASTNTPELLDGTGAVGDFGKVSVAGTHDFGNGAYSFQVGDWVIYAAGTWQRIGVHEAVASVNGKTGAVQLTAADVGARPGDWMPTAEQVGARPGNWMPTAEQVGARPSNWVPSWSQIPGKPSLYSPRGTISPPIPAVYRLAGTAQSIPVSSTTKITAWTGSGYDIFGMGDGSDFTVPAWASHARLTVGVRIQHVKSAGAGHLWIAAYLDNTLVASGQTQGTDNLSYPAALAMTGIIPVTAGSKFNIRAWHNDTTAKELHLGGACYINIELFESL